MTDNNYPITPPPELVEQWECEYHHSTFGPDLAVFISEKAARWGADQELEACINYFHEYDPSWGENSELITGLRDARRPKPPSLKERIATAIAHGDNSIALALLNEALPD